MNKPTKFIYDKEKSIEVSNIIGIGREDVGGEFKFSIDTSYVERGNTANITIYKENEDLTNEFIIEVTSFLASSIYGDSL